MKINVFVLWHRLVTEAILFAQKQSLEWPDGSDVYASFYGQPCDSISDEDIL